MAQCVVINAGGLLEASTADPCTSLLLLNPAEYATLAANPLLLTAEDGAIVSAAILGAWATAWAVRSLYRLLYIDGEINE